MSLATTQPPGAPGERDAPTIAESAAAQHAAVEKIEPRGLVPTEREAALSGDEVDTVVVERRAAAERRKLGFAKTMAKFVKDADPRHIGRPRLPLVVLGLVAAVGGWDLSLFLVIFPELSADFTFDATIAVALISATVLVQQVLTPVIGHLLDRHKRVYYLRVGSIITHLSSLWLGVAKGATSLLGSRVAMAFGQVVTGPSSTLIATDYYRTAVRTRLISYLGACTLLGTAIGPLASGAIAEALGWRRASLLLGGVSLAVCSLTFLIKEPVRGYWERIEAGASEEVALREEPPLAFRAALRALAGISTMRRLWIASVFTIAEILVVLYTQFLMAGKYGLGSRERGLLLAAQGVAGILGLVVGGPVGDRLLAYKPARAMTVYGLVLQVNALFILAVAFAPSMWVAIGFCLPGAFLTYLIAPARGALLSLVVPARLRGMATNSATPFTLLGAIVFGWVWLPLGALLFGFLGPIQASFAVLAIPTFIGGIILASGSVGVERDLRAAKSVALAEEETRLAKASGRSKTLVCRGIEVMYDSVQVLFGVDFDVQQGEIVALLGTNGAGKSTLLRAIAGVQAASAGAVFFDGVEITREPSHLNAAGGLVFVPGGHAIFPTLTVRENLRVAASVAPDDADALGAGIADVLALFPALEVRLDQLAGNLSGGEQQMLAIGQALLLKPRLLLIDELSLGLAPQIVQLLLDALRRIHAGGTTIVIVEQSLNVAISIAERAVFMEKGEVRFDGPISELTQRPELIRAVFLGGAAVGGGVKVRGRARVGELEPGLRVSDVHVSFGGVVALQGASVEVRKGEIVGIIGPNGAGKTTLFDVISGFVRPDSGEVRLRDVDVTSLGAAERAMQGLGRSFQNVQLFPALTVRENIAIAVNRRLPGRGILRAALWAPSLRKNEKTVTLRIDGLVDLLGLHAYADKFVNELSTGTRRTVDIACILASQPEVLLLDEPSSGLAQAETEALAPTIMRVGRETGCAMLVIEHDIGLISSIADRLVAMELGAVVAVGTPDEVVRHPKVMASYLEATSDSLSRSDLVEALGITEAEA